MTQPADGGLPEPEGKTMTRPAGDADLLRVEMGVIWRLDGRGRLTGSLDDDVPPTLVVGVAADGLAATVAADVPDDLSAQLLTLIAAASPPPPVLDTTNRPPLPPTPSTTDTPPPPRALIADDAHAPPFGEPPTVLERCRALLGEGLAVSGGPSYLVCPPIRFDTAARVLRSDDPAHARLVRPLRPGTWAPEEWDELVGGGAGAPWAMIVEDGQVASLCHSARRTPEGAEAGVWTAPEFRGRGYAAATTAVWADLLPGTRLFYSTSAGNRSSQSVAARLGLRCVGWLWKLTR
ncbi:GNAT family N-acetyltransferase [Nonomuraea purpurea]|uniref:GNAT family N-acetyltransferase n=1 Tax=Nonomuraea purpurea TaxID=1849276 RepID=A0ABV8GPH4_9ACTN